MSWFNAPANTVVIHSSDVFDDFVIRHEYAHFLQAQIGSFAWIPADHKSDAVIDGDLGSILHAGGHLHLHVDNTAVAPEKKRRNCYGV